MWRIVASSFICNHHNDNFWNKAEICQSLLYKEEYKEWSRCRIRFVEDWLWITLLREKIGTEIGWINLSKQRLYKHIIKTKPFPLHSRNPLNTKFPVRFSYQSDNTEMWPRFPNPYQTPSIVSDNHPSSKKKKSYQMKTSFQGQPIPILSLNSHFLSLWREG